MQKKVNGLGVKTGIRKIIIEVEIICLTHKKQFELWKNVSVMSIGRRFNWKAAGLDGLQRYRMKKLSGCHSRTADNRRPALCLKDVSEGNAANNYRPITCPKLLWNLFTCNIADET